MSINNIHSSSVGQVYRRTESATAVAPEAQKSTVAIDAEALHDLTKEVSYLTNVVGDLARKILDLKQAVVAMNANALGPAPARGTEAEAPIWENGMPVSSAEESAKLKDAFTAGGGLGRGLAIVNNGA